jgi:hypothetical protein
VLSACGGVRAQEHVKLEGQLAEAFGKGDTRSAESLTLRLTYVRTIISEIDRLMPAQ